MYYASRTGVQDRFGGRWASFFRFGLSLVDVCQAGACVGDDAEPLCNTRDFLATGSTQPIGSPQPDCFHGMVELCPCRSYGSTGIPQPDRTRRTNRLGCSYCYRRCVDRTGSGEVSRAGIGNPSFLTTSSNELSPVYGMMRPIWIAAFLCHTILLVSSKMSYSDACGRE